MKFGPENVPGMRAFIQPRYPLARARKRVAREEILEHMEIMRSVFGAEVHPSVN